LVVAAVAMVWIEARSFFVEGAAIPNTPVLRGTPVFAVDVNTAGVGELMAIPGVGPELAAAIVEHRNKVGHYETLDALTELSGVGPKTLFRLRGFLLPIESQRETQRDGTSKRKVVGDNAPIPINVEP
jgi:competence ComEA-like helix-hairpin-helix protein